jgi:hypothetical protein
MSENVHHTSSDGAVYNYREQAAGSTSTRVVQCVSAAVGQPTTELPALYEVVDPDALDTIVPLDGSGACSITFQYAGTDVHVSPGGNIRVVPAEDGERIGDG